MTDKEITKALECAIEYGCGHYIEIDAPTIKNTLDLINRQKAEIERLKGNAPKIFISDKTPSRYFKVKSQQPVLIYPYQETKIELVPSTEQTKAEAIKDFAERLKELINPDWCKIHQQIDNLVKEMIGE